jgi:hypothetical protein
MFRYLFTPHFPFRVPGKITTALIDFHLDGAAIDTLAIEDYRNPAALVSQEPTLDIGTVSFFPSLDFAIRL